MDVTWNNSTINTNSMDLQARKTLLENHAIACHKKRRTIGYSAAQVFNGENCIFQEGGVDQSSTRPEPSTLQ